MTEEQRMEEGRRMFQIFAARMFEQRVLTAYREKVARERQQKLIEELEEESQANVQREAKKQKEAQKKKDKKRQQKQAKEEERARKEAEKAAEEAAARAAEEKRQEEIRQRKEEQRKKREAEKKLQEEEKARKEAEKQKRLREERERQAELERKQREAKERERKLKEEAKRKEREEKEAREKEVRDRKAREEQERKTAEAAAKADQEAKERSRREEQESQQAPQVVQPPTKRPSQPGPAYLPPSLQSTPGVAGISSPHLAIATPVVPKAPTPNRPRQTSQQGSHGSSPKSQSLGTSIGTERTETTSLSNSPKGMTGQQAPVTMAQPSRDPNQQPVLHHPQPSVPMSPMAGAQGRGSHPNFGFNPMPGPGISGFPGSHPAMPPGMSPRGPLMQDMSPHQHQHQPMQMGAQFRNFQSPTNMPMHHGLNGNMPFPGGRGFPMGGHPSMQYHPQGPIPPPISAMHTNPMSNPGMSNRTHSRGQSLSYEKSSPDTSNAPKQTQPIARPAPIQRPSSVAPHERNSQESPNKRSDVDGLSAQLGSSALLEDTDIAPSENMPTSLAPGPPRPGRLGFGPPPLFSDMSGGKFPSTHFKIVTANSACQVPRTTTSALAVTQSMETGGVLRRLLELQAYPTLPHGATTLTAAGPAAAAPSA